MGVRFGQDGRRQAATQCDVEIDGGIAAAGAQRGQLLIELGQRIRPGLNPRTDRPPPPAAAATAKRRQAAARKAAPAGKSAGRKRAAAKR